MYRQGRTRRSSRKIRKRSIGRKKRSKSPSSKIIWKPWFLHTFLTKPRTLKETCLRFLADPSRYLMAMKENIPQELKEQIRSQHFHLYIYLGNGISIVP